MKINNLSQAEINDLFVTLLEKGLIDRKTCYKYFSQNFKKYTIEDFNSFKLCD